MSTSGGEEEVARLGKSPAVEQVYTTTLANAKQALKPKCPIKVVSYWPEMTRPFFSYCHQSFHQGYLLGLQLRQSLKGLTAEGCLQISLHQPGQVLL